MTAGTDSERFAHERLQKCRSIQSPRLLLDSLSTSALLCLQKKEFSEAEKLVAEANSLESKLSASEWTKVKTDLLLLNGRLNEFIGDSFPSTAKEQAISKYALARTAYSGSVSAAYSPYEKEKLLEALKSLARIEHKLGNDNTAWGLLFRQQRR